MKLGDILDNRQNSLNALRLVFAMLVIVSHAPLVGGFGEPVRFGDLELGGWSVDGFFVISGWLITGSRLHLSFPSFLWRRLLRIYPAFWVSLLMVAFVFAPLATAVGGGHYPPAGAAGYAARNATLWILQPSIPGTLSGADYQSHWNLSLWTLHWEFGCYLGIAALLGLAWTRARHWVVLVVFVAISVPYAVAVAANVEVGHGADAVCRLAGSFLAGAVAYVYRDKIPVNRLLVVAAAVAILACGFLGVARGFSAIPLAYLTLWLGGVLPLRQVGRRNDISYGVYIYAFPVQQLLAIAGVASLGLWAYTVSALVAVVPFAWASWLLIERPALRYKAVWGRVPGRRPTLAGATGPGTPTEPPAGP